MNRQHTVIFSVLISWTAAIAQNWTWSAKTDELSALKHIEKDHQGNVYQFQDRHSEVDTVKRFSPGGALLMAMKMPANIKASKCCVAADNGFFAGGIFSGTVVIGNNTLISKGHSDIWIARYTGNGVQMWIRSFGSKGNDELFDMCANAGQLVLTGVLADTTNLLGMYVPKAGNPDLFAAVVDLNGNATAAKAAVATHTQFPSSQQPSTAYSHGSECAMDAAGNIYILAEALGINTIDTYQIGEWGQHYLSPDFTRTLLKLNSSLQVTRATKLQQCVYYCGTYSDLVVSHSGHAYVIYKFNYSQSGNDIDNSMIFGIDGAGLVADTFRLQPKKNSRISAIDLDGCGNVYFTGYSRFIRYETPFHYVFTVGQLSPSLTVNWIREDSSSTNTIIGSRIAALNYDDCFVTGTFNDTITLATAHSGTGTEGFYARITGTQSVNCNTVTTGIPQIVQMRKVLCFPNPASGKFRITGVPQGSSVNIFDVNGRIVFAGRMLTEELSLDKFASGFYSVCATGPGGERYFSRLVVTD